MWGLDRRRIKGEEIGLITIVGFIGYFFWYKIRKVRGVRSIFGRLKLLAGDG